MLLNYVPVLKQLQDSETRSYYIFSGHTDDSRTAIKFPNPKYLSMLNHLRLLFPALKKVVFLDNDLVVQKNLSGLFSIEWKCQGIHGDISLNILILMHVAGHLG
ncbi:galacturonosyltransferase 10 [Euphorbia peplus]|nr:galacturonosyltransferase 10 [Euphorbia peplus]